MPQSAIKCHKTPQNDKTAQGTLIFLGWVIFDHLWSFDSLIVFFKNLSSLSDFFCPTLVFWSQVSLVSVALATMNTAVAWMVCTARVSKMARWARGTSAGPRVRLSESTSTVKLGGFDGMDPALPSEVCLGAMVWGVSRKFSESIWSHRGWLEKWWYHVDLSKKNGEFHGIQWDFTCFTINLLGCNPLDRSH